MGYLDLLAAFADDRTPDETPDGAVARVRNAGMVISVVVIGVVSLVGLLIFGQVWDAMDWEPYNETEDTGDILYSEAEGVMTGFGDAMGLVPIILLVLLAAVVINVVNRMR